MKNKNRNKNEEDAKFWSRNLLISFDPTSPSASIISQLDEISEEIFPAVAPAINEVIKNFDTTDISNLTPAIAPIIQEAVSNLELVNATTAKPTSMPTPLPTLSPTPSPTPRPSVAPIISDIVSSLKEELGEKNITQVNISSVVPALAPEINEKVPTFLTEIPTSILEGSLAPIISNLFEALEITSLKILIDENAANLETIRKIADDYNEYTEGRVKVSFETTSDIYSKISADQSQEVSSYDGYIVSPTNSGNAGLVQGFTNLTTFLSNNELNWNDIFSSYRDSITKFNNTAFFIPLQGEVLSMYYRSDVLDAFDLSPPKTWFEYTRVAQAVHGVSYEDTTLIGSCVPRNPTCSDTYIWTNLVLSSFTQHQGTSSGFLFDPFTMKPITGEAMVIAIEYLEGQVLYGAEDEFQTCGDETAEEVNKWLNEGRCVLTYSWGNMFSSQSDNIRGRLGVSRTPGSSYFLDRSTKKLSRCNADSCSDYDVDWGYINYAPYGARSGLAGAIPSTIKDANQREETLSFFAYASNSEQKRSHSTEFITSDPYRESQLNISAYTKEGFTEVSVDQYFESISLGLNSDNTVMDVRVPDVFKINQVLEDTITPHLQRIKEQGFFSTQEERIEVADSITLQLEQVIAEYNVNHKIQLVDQYQASLNFDSMNTFVTPLLSTPAAVEETSGFTDIMHSQYMLFNTCSYMMLVVFLLMR